MRKMDLMESSSYLSLNYYYLLVKLEVPDLVAGCYRRKLASLLPFYFLTFYD
jgi:hypothetical protein